MANKDFSDVANHGSGSGVSLPKRGPATSSASLNMKNKSYPGLPGKSGPKRDTMGVRHPPQHAQDNGL